jgi:hypothetical protein
VSHGTNIALRVCSLVRGEPTQSQPVMAQMGVVGLHPRQRSDSACLMSLRFSPKEALSSDSYSMRELLIPKAQQDGTQGQAEAPAAAAGMDLPLLLHPRAYYCAGHLQFTEWESCRIPLAAPTAFSSHPCGPTASPFLLLPHHLPHPVGCVRPMYRCCRGQWPPSNCCPQQALAPPPVLQSAAGREALPMGSHGSQHPDAHAHVHSFQVAA